MSKVPRKRVLLPKAQPSKGVTVESDGSVTLTCVSCGATQKATSERVREINAEYKRRFNDIPGSICCPECTAKTFEWLAQTLELLAAKPKGRA